MGNQQSALLTLPPKLRNSIYEMALTSETPKDIALHSRPALLAVCKLIRQEASGVYYTSKDFVLGIQQIDVGSIRTTLDLIGRENTSVIPSLNIRLDISAAAHCFLTARGKVTFQALAQKQWEEIAHHIVCRASISKDKIVVQAPRIMRSEEFEVQRIAAIRMGAKARFYQYVEVKVGMQRRWKGHFELALRRAVAGVLEGGVLRVLVRRRRHVEEEGV